MLDEHIYDVIVVGGGPSGATAADDLARAGRSVLLLDRAGRIKPCGGAIPPRAIRDFAIPDSVIVARIQGARMVAPSGTMVDMPIDDGYVGMVDRDTFDEFLRARAERSGARRVNGTFQKITRNGDGHVTVHYQPGPHRQHDGAEGTPASARARLVIGADGAKSLVARQEVPGAEKMPYVFAYHEIVRAPSVALAAYDSQRCDVIYNGKLSSDFYSWVFPHGDTASIGTGTAEKGTSLRGAIAELRRSTGLDGVETIRREGAPIPLKPLKRWDNGRDVLLAGDAAGVVAPASGEGIYYAMLGGRLAAEAALKFCHTGAPAALRTARAGFMKDHGRVFWILGIMQYFWYSSDKRREAFVKICRDKDVQRLTWESYMNKTLAKKDPMAHLRIFFKDLAHLFGLARA